MAFDDCGPNDQHDTIGLGADDAGVRHSQKWRGVDQNYVIKPSGFLNKL